MAYIAKVQVLLDVKSESEAADAVNEILREQQREFTPQSCLIDFAQAEHQPYEPFDIETYIEGDFLIPISPSPYVYTALCRESYGKGTIWSDQIQLEKPIDPNDPGSLENAKQLARQACSEDWDMATWRIDCIGLFPGHCPATFLP